MDWNKDRSLLKSEKWQNLGLMALVIFYIIQFGMDIAWKNMCGHLAIDYCAFWSTGVIANNNYFSEVYNMELLGELQRSIFPQKVDAIGVPGTIPTPYLPIFLLPFKFLSFLGPYVGFWVWNLINGVIFYYYVRFFAVKMTGEKVQKRILLLVLLSWPVFLNFFYGQVNLWLTIFIGEYMRAVHSKKPFHAGLWLGGLLIKPQFLVLIVIALLIQRSVKILLGFAVSSIAILGISFILIGYEGFLSLLQLLIGFGKGIAATGPNVMMNWRMVGIFLSTVMNSNFVWTLVFIGIIATAILGLYSWRKPIAPNSPTFAISILCILAATNAAIWHSHISSATILICPLILLSQPQNRLPKNTLELWVLVPPTFHFLAILLASFVQANALPTNLTDFLNFLSAIAPFSFNLYFTIWAIREMEKSNPEYLPRTSIST